MAKHWFCLLLPLIAIFALFSTISAENDYIRGFITHNDVVTPLDTTNNIIHFLSAEYFNPTSPKYSKIQTCAGAQASKDTNYDIFASILIDVPENCTQADINKALAAFSTKLKYRWLYWGSNDVNEFYILGRNNTGLYIEFNAETPTEQHAMLNDIRFEYLVQSMITTHWFNVPEDRINTSCVPYNTYQSTDWSDMYVFGSHKACLISEVAATAHNLRSLALVEYDNLYNNSTLFGNSYAKAAGSFSITFVSIESATIHTSGGKFDTTVQCDFRIADNFANIIKTQNAQYPTLGCNITSYNDYNPISDYESDVFVQGSTCDFNAFRKYLQGTGCENIRKYEHKFGNFSDIPIGIEVGGLIVAGITNVTEFQGLLRQLGSQYADQSIEPLNCFNTNLHHATTFEITTDWDYSYHNSSAFTVKVVSNNLTECKPSHFNHEITGFLEFIATTPEFSVFGQDMKLSPVVWGFNGTEQKSAIALATVNLNCQSNNQTLNEQVLELFVQNAYESESRCAVLDEYDILWDEIGIYYPIFNNTCTSEIFVEEFDEFVNNNINNTINQIAKCSLWSFKGQAAFKTFNVSMKFKWDQSQADAQNINLLAIDAAPTAFIDYLEDYIAQQRNSDTFDDATCKLFNYNINLEQSAEDLFIVDFAVRQDETCKNPQVVIKQVQKWAAELPGIEGVEEAKQNNAFALSTMTAAIIAVVAVLLF